MSVVELYEPSDGEVELARYRRRHFAVDAGSDLTCRLEIAVVRRRSGMRHLLRQSWDSRQKTDSEQSKYLFLHAFLLNRNVQLHLPHVPNNSRQTLYFSTSFRSGITIPVKADRGKTHRSRSVEGKLEDQSPPYNGGTSELAPLLPSILMPALLQAQAVSRKRKEKTTEILELRTIVLLSAIMTVNSCHFSSERSQRCPSLQLNRFFDSKCLLHRLRRHAI